MRRSSILARGVGILVAVGMVTAVGLRIARANPEDLKGKPAPEFTLKTFGDKPDATLSQLKGNVVVVDFWATWCPPCRASLPHVQKLSADKERFDKGLRVLAVNDQETKDKIAPFMTQNSYTFAVPMDTEGKALGAYGVEGIPTTVVIGRDGVVRAVFVGFGGEQSAKAIDDAVDSALKEQ